VALSKERESPRSREGEALRRACDTNTTTRTSAKEIAPCKARRNIGTGALQPHDTKTRHPVCSEQYAKEPRTISQQ
jgi:hypothetical protein